MSSQPAQAHVPIVWQQVGLNNYPLVITEEEIALNTSFRPVTRTSCGYLSALAVGMIILSTLSPILLAQVSQVDMRNSSAAKTTINAIWQAAQIFQQDQGKWPASVDELIQAKVIEIAPSTTLQWQFYLVGSPLQSILAVSTPSMKAGAGKTIEYDVDEGVWRGYGLPNDQEITAAQRQADLSTNAKTTISAIWQAAQVFHQDKGHWPDTFEDIVKERYIEVAPSTESLWQFAIVGNPPKTIVAISKKAMPDGAGHALEYDISRGVWYGYGLPQ